MNRGDFFKGVIQWDMMTKDMSLEGKLPVFYYDNTSMTAIYTASTEKVRRLLPLTDMHPVEAMSGRALVAFTAFEYRKTDIDPYNEFSISFPITFRKKVHSGHYRPGNDAKEILHGIRLAASRYDRTSAQGRRGNVRVSQIPCRHHVRK